MIFRKAEKEDFYKIRSLYWNLIDQEQNDLSFPHWKKNVIHEWMKFTSEEQKDNGMVLCGRYGS